VYGLSEEEIKSLKVLHRETKDADVRSRCEMILLSNDGLSPPQIAERVRFSRRTVTRYIKRYEAAGVAGLLPKPHPGRPPRVTPEYVTQLLAAVDENPRALGLPFSNWTTGNLTDYMAEQTGISITPRQVENYLKVNDRRLRRPTRTVKHKQDPTLLAEKKTNRRVAGPGQSHVHRPFR
jgi:putative transposase